MEKHQGLSEWPVSQVTVGFLLIYRGDGFYQMCPRREVLGFLISVKGTGTQFNVVMVV